MQGRHRSNNCHLKVKIAQFNFPAVQVAKEAIDSGAAKKKLAEWVEVTAALSRA